METNGHPLEADQDPSIFAFEHYAIEVILQNILSKAMEYGYHIQVGISEAGTWVRIEVRDK